MEMYFGVSGSVACCTINPLHPEQIAWIVNHAEDQVLCFDLTFCRWCRRVRKCTVKKWVRSTYRQTPPVHFIPFISIHLFPFIPCSIPFLVPRVIVVVVR